MLATLKRSSLARQMLSDLMRENKTELDLWRSTKENTGVRPRTLTWHHVCPLALRLQNLEDDQESEQAQFTEPEHLSWEWRQYFITCAFCNT